MMRVCRAMRDLSYLVRPPAYFYMAAVRAYLDDSSMEGDLALAGYVAPLTVWEEFETKWQTVLKEYDLQHFHRKELVGRSGEFASWPCAEDPDIAPIEASLLTDLALTTSHPQFLGFGVIIPRLALSKFNAENSLRITSKRLALFWLSIIFSHLFDREDNFQVIIDRMDKAQDAIIFTQETFKRWFKRELKPTFTALSRAGSIGANNTPALQIADFLAGELCQEYKMKRPFYESDPPPRLDDPMRLNKLWIWFAKERQRRDLERGIFPSEIPAFPHRRSLLALHNATTITAQIVDSAAMRKIAEAGRGRWPKMALHRGGKGKGL